MRNEVAKTLNVADPAAGWTPAYSLNPALARQTADFLIFSSLTTVARRPGLNWSWTENWPYEPLVGNTPTTNTFRWTWISFCFTFFAFGLVIFIYEFFLSDPDDAPMDPILAKFGALTPSQKRVGKYFLVVAALLLVQIGAGTIMAHSYYDRTSFYGIAINRLIALQFPARRAHPGADHLDRAVLDRRGAVSRARHRRREGSQGPGIAGRLSVLGDTAGRRRRPDRRLSRNHGGDHDQNWFWFGNQGLSYIELGRFWQIGFFVGLALWSVLVLRALWPTAGLWRKAARAVLDRPHSPGTSDLGLHHQYRRPLCVRHGPAYRDREILHA